MRLLALTVLVTAISAGEPRRVVLLEELVRIEAMRSRSYDFPMHQQKAALDLSWTLKDRGTTVRVLVIDRRLSSPAYDSGYQTGGSRRVKLERAGEYQVTIENRQQLLGSALVDFRMDVVFGEERPVVSEGPTPARRFWTIAASIALFAMMVSYAGVRLGPAVLDRWFRRRV